MIIYQFLKFYPSHLLDFDFYFVEDFGFDFV